MILGWAYWWTFLIAARKREITTSAREFGSATIDTEDPYKLLPIWEPLQIVFMDEEHTIYQTRGIQLPPVSMIEQLLGEFIAKKLVLVSNWFTELFIYWDKPV